MDGVNRSSRDGGPRPSSRAWSPPLHTRDDSVSVKRDRDLDPPLGPRSTSPKPSGRIAMPDSQLPPTSMPPPIFSSPYNRDPSNLLYQRLPGLNRPETSMKPSSSSLSFSSSVSRGKSDLPSPGARDSHYYDINSGPSNRNSVKSPNGDHDRERERSPHASNQRPSSSDQFDHKPRSMTSDSTTEKGNSPGAGNGPRRYPEDDSDRNGRRSHDHVKTERCGSPSESRARTFSGDFSRESLSRLSQSSGGSRNESLIGSAAQGNNPIIGERISMVQLLL